MVWVVEWTAGVERGATSGHNTTLGGRRRETKPQTPLFRLPAPGHGHTLTSHTTSDITQTLPGGITSLRLARQGEREVNYVIRPDQIRAGRA